MWRSPTWVFVGVAAAAGLAVGLVVGERTHLIGAGSSSSDGTVAGPLTAGPVGQITEGPGQRWDFELPVFNSADQEVDARLVAFGSFPSPLLGATVENLSPGTWGVIPFSVTPNCDKRAPRALTTVRVRVQAPDGGSVTELPLPGEGEVLLDHHRTFCANANPVDPADIAGVWMVEKVYGKDTDLVEPRVMRFNPDGSFVADQQGELFTEDADQRGTYRVEGELLVVEVAGGYLCRAGAEVVWRVTSDGSDRMSMVWVRGDCADGAQGDAWVAQRVLRDTGLPKQPG
jgi:hypothetical protein